MKKLLSSKLLSWFQTIDNLLKNYDKSSKIINNKLLIIVNEFKSDLTILSSINNIFVELIYSFHHPFDDRTSLEVIQSVCSNLCKLFQFPDRRIALLALDILPSFLFAYLCICNSHPNDPCIPKRQRSRRRSSSISPFNESRKSFNSQHLDKFSVIDILELHLLSLYNFDVKKDILCRSSNQEFRFPNPSDASIYSNAIFNFQFGTIDSISRESYSHSSTSLIPNTDPLRVCPSNNSLDVHKSTENDVGTEIIPNNRRNYLVVITSENRSKIMKHFLDIYMENIVEVSQSSLMSMIKLIVHMHPERQQIIFPPRQGRKSTNLQLPRIPELGVQVYLEMTSIAYYALFNGLSHRAIEAINALEARANLEFYSEILLITTSIKNNIESIPFVHSSDSSLGMNRNSNEYIVTSLLSFNDTAALCAADGFNTSQHEDTIINDYDHLPTLTSPVKAKLRSIITNASFRTVKLPDDIPIIEISGTNSSLAKNHNTKLSYIKSPKTPRFKFDFKGSDKFEGIKEYVSQEQYTSITPPSHSVFFGKNKKVTEDDANEVNNKNEDSKRISDSLFHE